MRLDREEIQAIAEALAPLTADILKREVCEWPEMAKSIPEAAAYAKVEESTIRNAIRDGRLPHFKCGHQVRIKLSDLFTVRGEDS